MPEMSTEGTGFASLEAVVIRADGTKEELGVIASAEPAIRRFQCVSSQASIEFSGEEQQHSPVLLAYGEILTVEGPGAVTATYGTIQELKDEEED